MLTAQDVDFLDYVETHPGVSARALADRFSVCERTVRTYVKRVNEDLKEAGRIEKRRGAGYVFTAIDSGRLAVLRAADSPTRAQQLPTTPDGRVSYLLDDLLSRADWITLDDLSNMLFVSRNAISTVLKQVERILDRFNLRLEKRPHYGIRISGSEMSRRLCLANSALDGVIKPRSGALSNRATLDAISNCVDSIAEEEAFQINSAVYQNLLVHIAIAISRIREGCYVPIEAEHLDRLRGTREYGVATRISSSICARFDIHLPDVEVAYIAIHLASKRSLCPAPGEGNEGIVISDEVWGVVSDMIETVRKAFHFDFTEDLELRMNLACHITPLAVRIRYRMRIDNPLLSDIKERFPLAYSMSLDASAVLISHYGGTLSEDEIGYIALAFALAIERQKCELPRKNILIVCVSGQGTAKLLEWRYRQEFGTLLNSIITCDVSHLDRMDMRDIDYVFTTVPLQRSLPVPVREVKFFLDDEDTRLLRRLLSCEISSRELTRYFDEKLFMTHLKSRTKEDVIATMCAHISRERNVPPDFHDFVLRRERAAITSFGNQVAMPHPIEACTEETFVCVGILDDVIAWSGHEVRVVFLLSVSRAPHKKLDPLYRGMAGLISSGQAIGDIAEHQTWDVLLNHLAEYATRSERK